MRVSIHTNTLLFSSKLSPDQLSFLHKTIDLDAFRGIVEHHLLSGKGMSVVRANDGEANLIELYKGNPERFNRWNKISTVGEVECSRLAKLGLDGMDLKEVGASLLKAGNEADYFCPNIYGLYLQECDVYKHFPDVQHVVNFYYPHKLNALGAFDRWLEEYPAIVLHRYADVIVKGLVRRYGAIDCKGIKMDSWRDKDRVEDAVANSRGKLVLVSGGPWGKYFMVELARKYNKVVLDIGHAMVSIAKVDPKYQIICSKHT